MLGSYAEEWRARSCFPTCLGFRAQLRRAPEARQIVAPGGTSWDTCFKLLVSPEDGTGLGVVRSAALRAGLFLRRKSQRFALGYDLPPSGLFVSRCFRRAISVSRCVRSGEVQVAVRKCFLRGV